MRVFVWKVLRRTPRPPFLAVLFFCVGLAAPGVEWIC